MPSVIGANLFRLPIYVRMSAAIAADSTLWGFRVPPPNIQGTRKVRVRSLRLYSGFDGTPAVGGSVRYELRRFDTSDLATLTDLAPPLKTETSNPVSSVVTNARQSDGSAGLTGGTFTGGMAGVLSARWQPNQYMTVDEEFLPRRPWDTGLLEPVVLLPGQGLAIRNGIVGVIGQLISGFCEFEEGWA